MTKVRPSGTTEDALLRVFGLLGIKEAAKIIGKEPSTLRAYADPNKGKQISLAGAMALDAVMLEAHKETPFFSMQQTVLEASGFGGPVDVIEELLNLHCAAARLTEMVRTAKSAQSPGGKRLTISEEKKIHDLTDEVLILVHGVRASFSNNRTADKEAA